MDIVPYSKQAIANIQTIEEATDGYEKLKALVSYFGKDYAQAFNLSVSMIEYACRGGELIKEMQENGELATRKNMKSQADTSKLSDLDINKSQSSRWQKMASVPVEKRQEYYSNVQSKNDLPTNSGILKLAKEKRRREQRQEQIKSIEEIPLLTQSELFHVIVVDPPWAYQKRPDDITHRAANPYPSMTTEEISEIEIPAADNCILWLWTTNSFMEEAHQIVKMWGFEKKTILTWVKHHMGLGDWLRGKTEHCLMCIRGNPIVNLTNQTTVIEGPLREHSRKPDEFYQLVNELCYGSKLEIFAREKREGWTSYGIEDEKF